MARNTPEAGALRPSHPIPASIDGRDAHIPQRRSHGLLVHEEGSLLGRTAAHSAFATPMQHVVERNICFDDVEPWNMTHRCKLDSDGIRSNRRTVGPPQLRYTHDGLIDGNAARKKEKIDVHRTGDVRSGVRRTSYGDVARAGIDGGLFTRRAPPSTGPRGVRGLKQQRA